MDANLKRYHVTIKPVTEMYVVYAESAEDAILAARSGDAGDPVDTSDEGYEEWAEEVPEEDAEPALIGARREVWPGILVMGQEAYDAGQ